MAGVQVERWLALGATALLGTRLTVYAGITVGSVLAVLLAPLWFTHYLRDRLRIALLVLGTAALGWGYVLRTISAANHTIDPRQSIVDSAVLLQLILGVGVLMWAREVAGLAMTGLWFAGGILAQGVLTAEYGTADPWKSFLAVPLAVGGLSLLARRSHVADLVALILLAAASGALNSRSYAATFAIAALLRLWQLRPRSLSRRGSVSLTVALFALLAGGIYWLGQTLLVAGYLGSAAQQRSIDQIRASGSLIVGGRPELAATIALMRERITGHGVGVNASYHDITIAKDAMSAIGYDPNNGYVDRFMFGTGIELHSVIGDLWARWGLPGLALFVLIACVVVARLTAAVLDRTADGITLFLSCWSLWNLLFSPLYSALPTLTMCLAVLLASAPGSASKHGAQHGPQTLGAAADGGPQRPG